MKELQAVNQNVILDITDYKKENKTSSGIIIPKTFKSDTNIAQVVGMAPVAYPEIAIGDTVVFLPTEATHIEFENKKFLILPISNILAKIVETEII